MDRRYATDHGLTGRFPNNNYAFNSRVGVNSQLTVNFKRRVFLVSVDFLIVSLTYSIMIAEKSLTV